MVPHILLKSVYAESKVNASAGSDKKEWDGGGGGGREADLQNEVLGEDVWWHLPLQHEAQRSWHLQGP